MSIDETSLIHFVSQLNSKSMSMPAASLCTICLHPRGAPRHGC